MELSKEQIELIRSSVHSALRLLNDEIECVEDDDLYSEYESVILELEKSSEILEQ